MLTYSFEFLVYKYTLSPSLLNVNFPLSPQIPGPCNESHPSLPSPPSAHLLKTKINEKFRVLQKIFQN